jgi:hypothetical protein
MFARKSLFASILSFFVWNEGKESKVAPGLVEILTCLRSTGERGQGSV